MDIVKFGSGKYALRKRGWIMGYVYADLDDLEHNDHLRWWRGQNMSWTRTPNLNELETYIDNYNPELAMQKLKDKRKARKEAMIGQVIKQDVKFGRKNK